MSKTIPATDYCYSIFDGTHDTPKQSDIGYPLVTSKHMTGDILNISEAYLISNEDFESINRRSKVSQWDILFSMIGTVGEVYLERSSSINYAIKNIGVFSCKDEKRAEWLYYYLRSPAARKHIQRYLSGAVQKFLSLGALRYFPVLPFDEKAIVAIGIVAAIDKKIELNNRINAELEAMAKTLYDYWFVQFDFPDDSPQGQCKPYKTSGGKMVYNPTLKREIPEGWEASNVLKVANLLGGGTPTKTKKEYWNGTIPFFTPTDSDKNIFSVETEDYITAEGLKKSSTRLFEPYTVFITARGSVGRLALNSVPMAMNQSCYALRAKDGISYTFLFFLTKELIHHLEVKASGSVFNSIVSNDIEYTNLAVPGDLTLMEKYAAIVEPIFEKIESTTKENKKLSSLRDWLLPMLMNGQVTVGEAS